MPESFLLLPSEERQDILTTAAAGLRIEAKVLEKDVWVCWCLEAVFSLPGLVDSLAFKGGTSLSKAYGAINRFSEDVDITVDHRILGFGEDPVRGLGSTKRKQRCEEIDGALKQYIESTMAPALAKLLRKASKPPATVELLEGGDGLCLRVLYPSALGGDLPKYFQEGVLLEFGARNVVQPVEAVPIKTDLSRHPGLAEKLRLPSPTVNVLKPVRTFWEKVTLVHSENHRPEPKGKMERKSRHLYDLVKLMAHDLGQAAIIDRRTLEAVVKTKNDFYYSAWANYGACLTGALRLVPQGACRDEFHRDYQGMIDAGMFLGEPPPFDELLKGLQAIETLVNTQAKP